MPSIKCNFSQINYKIHAHRVKQNKYLIHLSNILKNQELIVLRDRYQSVMLFINCFLLIKDLNLSHDPEKGFEQQDP